MPSARSGTADLSGEAAVPSYTLLMAAFWAICGKVREETGAENVPPFPLVRIENRR